jgi:hypothetical protein
MEQDGKGIKKVKSSSSRISSKDDSASMNLVAKEITLKMKQLCDNLPPYQWYTALPQLISRIAHRNADVFACLKNIIRKIVIKYPDQSLWRLMGVKKSKFETRKVRATEILKAGEKYLSM